MTTSNDVPPPPSPSPPPLAGEDDGDDNDGRTRRSSSNSSGALATTADDDAGRRDGFVFLDMIIVMDCLFTASSQNEIHPAFALSRTSGAGGRGTISRLRIIVCRLRSMANTTLRPMYSPLVSFLILLPGGSFWQIFSSVVIVTLE